MSEISVLSHEYLAAADFAQRITRALIQLKKSVLLPGKQETPPEELAAYRNELATVLAGLILALSPTPGDAIAFEAANRIPGALLVRLQEERQGDLEYYIEDLENTVQRLRNVQEQSLTEQDFQLLDDLASKADAQTSQVFHRMMRK